MTVEDTYSSTGPECPHCGHVHNPADDPEFYYNERRDELDCDKCGKKSRMEVYVSHSWTCEAIGEDE